MWFSAIQQCESTLEMKSEFRRQRPWRDVMRAAEGRQKVVKRVLVRHIHSRHLETPLVAITIEEVVLSDGGVKEIPLSNSGRIMVVIAGARGRNA
jgi:hypothetical protein